MKLLDLTLASPHANVALDEALLESSDRADTEDILRLWEPSEPLVVVGRSSVVSDEVQIEYCRRHGIPIVRRCSGGAAIVTGPGCLMYALVLSLKRWPQLEMLDAAHRMVLQRNSQALQELGIAARQLGISDLAVGDRKISGNSLRRTRGSVLYHGTLLYDFSADLVEACLKTAPRQPDYRRGRSHIEFIANIPATTDVLKFAIARAWEARTRLDGWPVQETDRLVAERYATDEWNLRR